MELLDERMYEILPYWPYLSEHEKDFVRNTTVLLKYPKGQIIECEGNNAIGVFGVISGELRPYMLSKNGQEVSLFRLHPKENCVLSAACLIPEIRVPTQISVERDCMLAAINPEPYSHLVTQNEAVHNHLYAVATKHMADIMFTFQQVMGEKLDTRIAAFLVSEFERTGKYAVTITHEQLASNLNSARETVTRVLKRFTSDGLIEGDRGKIILLDVDRLKLISLS